MILPRHDRLRGSFDLFASTCRLSVDENARTYMCTALTGDMQTVHVRTNLLVHVVHYLVHGNGHCGPWVQALWLASTSVWRCGDVPQVCVDGVVKRGGEQQRLLHHAGPSPARFDLCTSTTRSAPLVARSDAAYGWQAYYLATCS
jgi:hypothetical protein